jgi:hypothetical protein
VRLPEPVWRLLLAAMFVVFVGVVWRDLTSVSKGPDYCALANLRTCRVSDRGEWVQVTTPDGATHTIYTKGGKVVAFQ